MQRRRVGGFRSRQTGKTGKQGNVLWSFQAQECRNRNIPQEHYQEAYRGIP